LESLLANVLAVSLGVVMSPFAFIAATGRLFVDAVFILVGASLVAAVPAAILLIRKENALGTPECIRTWITPNTELLNVGVLVLIAIMQRNKGIQGL
jgi:hypothetical protein